MIYGATGYTGRLVAEEAASRGLKPMLAARNADKLQALAKILSLPYRTFDLDKPESIAAGLKGMKLVLHCAGPFSKTSAPMVSACLKAGVHYLDITGEIAVFENIFKRDEEAKKEKVTLLPGVGFDVVPSDCLASLLHERLPQATELSLAFAPDGKPSPGTLKTAVESLGEGSRVRRGGKWKTIPMASLTREVPFSHRKLSTTAIPWGDLSTAYRSTGIPDITTYVATPPSLQRAYRLASKFSALGRFGIVQTALKKIIEARVSGPSEEERNRGRVYMWGEVKDAKGNSASATLEVPEGYRFTVLAALACVDKILTNSSPTGAVTPSIAFGAEFLFQLPEIKFKWQ